MKKPFILLTFFVSCLILEAQENDLESIIRSLEKKELQAVLEKDTTALRNLWSDDFTVNSPFNRVVQAGKNALDRPVITQFRYSAFERNVEHIMVKEDVVISMGSEVVVQQGVNGAPERTIKRRYTNIWMKENKQWKLTARHANEVCATE